ncbi:MAG: thiamine pyrophosphate-dependent dehydrogenase E1 component subunit alpha [Azospirillaceae bacterium]
MSNDPVALFAAMVRLRKFDEACLQGVPTHEIHGELHTGLGQEAIAAGMEPSLRPDDAVVSTHRNHYHGLVKGVPAEAMMAEIFEKETGLCGGYGGHMHPFDPERNFSATGIVGASLPVAAGYAYAYRLAGKDAIAVGVTGDGGTNTGGFHETLNMAGAWKLPLVVLVENNRLAISVDFHAVTATVDIETRAAAYGAWARSVDGTDVEAVRDAFAEAAAHARTGKGPAVLEASCYRFSGHYEGDHDSYRTREEKKRMRVENDPIPLYRERLIERGEAAAEELDAIDARLGEEAAAMLADVRAASMPDPKTALKPLFVEEGR